MSYTSESLPPTRAVDTAGYNRCAVIDFGSTPLSHASGPAPHGASETLVHRNAQRTVASIAVIDDDGAPARSVTPDELAGLLPAVAAGDRAAFQALYRQTSARVFATVRRVVWSAPEAEELLQEIYVKIWRHAGSFDPSKARSLTWMVGIARNHAVDHLRRDAGRRAHETSVDAAEAAPLDDADPNERPDACLERLQQAREFDGLMARLPASQRQVLVLSLRDGLTQTEIASRLGAPLGSVKSWTRRGLQALKRLVDAPGGRRDGPVN